VRTSLDIRTYGDKILRSKNEKIREFGEELKSLFAQLTETMIVSRGVGLAAPQVGIAKQIAVVNPEPEAEKTLIKMANPRIVWTSDETETLEEGCLSVPGIRGEVVRHSSIEVAYQDEQGNERTLKAEGLLARIIQHEIDHLNGVLFVDRLSFAKRALIKPKLKDLASGRKKER
jgi:peptide deformylase